MRGATLDFLGLPAMGPCRDHRGKKSAHKTMMSVKNHIGNSLLGRFYRAISVGFKLRAVEPLHRDDWGSIWEVS